MERKPLLFGPARRATFLVFCLLLAGFGLRAQQSVSIGSTTIKANAVLYLSSAGKNQGLIIPIVSNRNSVTGEAGMIVYDESDNKLYYRNTSAWVEISGAGGAITLGGDLSGTTTAANVARIQGKTISATTPADGQILKFVAATQTWTLSADNGAVYTQGTGITIASNQISIAADGVTTTQIAPNTITNADLNKTTIPLSGFGAATAAVDLGTQRAINLGTPTAATDATTKAYVDAAVATKLNSNILTTAGDLLSHDGTNTIRFPRGTNTQVLQSTATGIQWVNNTALTNPMNTLGDILFGGAGGVATRLGGAAGFLKSTGAAAPTWSAVNLASTDVTGVVPIANGGTNANTAALARTNLGLGTMAVQNNVTSAHITDLEIVNADVSNSAAIAGTKIVPTFGAQSVLTNGSVGIGTLTPTAQLDISTSGGAKTPQAILQQTAATGDAVQTFSTPLDKYTVGTNAGGSFKISNGALIGTGPASSGVIDATDHVEITPGIADGTGLAKMYFNMGPRGQDGIQVMSTSDWGTAIHLSNGTSMSTTAGYTMAVTGPTFATGPGDFAIVSGIGSVMTIGSNSGFYATNFPTVDGIFSDTPMRVGINLASSANPAFNLEVNGSAAKNSGASWTVTSDKRLKQDISKYSDGLDLINKINPVWFRYNGRGGTRSDGRLQVGVIAQEMKEIAPYTVNSFQAKYDDTSPEQEFYSFDYSAIGYALINAVKELDTKVKALEKENALLKQQLGNSSKAPLSDVTQLKAELDSQKIKTDQLEAELKEIKRLLGAEAKKN